MTLKKTKGFALGALLFFLITPKVLATTDYVLPYPGLMPGHKVYFLKEVFNQFYRLFVFGSFALHKYELELADKKLVEAKVLFEYQQYLLGVKALTASNEHFQKADHYLERAKEEGKEISLKLASFKAAGVKHNQILKRLKEELPSEFLWQPEKGEATQLNLESAIEEAIKIREI